MKTLRNVGIAGTGFYFPEQRVSNDDLKKHMATSSSWIEDKIGIKERRVVAEDECLSDLAYHASNEAIEKAEISVDDIDLIIVCAVNQDKRIPATANILQKKLKAKNAATFDVNVGGCPGTVYALVIGQQFVTSGMYDTVLVVSGEVYSKLLDWSDRNISMFFGDGVGAAILKPCKPGKGILSSVLGADSEWGADKVVMEGGSLHTYSEHLIKENRHRIRMDNREVWNFGTTIFPKIVKEASAKANIEVDKLDLVIPHQANINMIKHGMKTLRLGMDKVFTNLEYYANTGAGSVIIALADAVAQEKIKENDTIALASFGAGFSWGSAIVNWCSKEDFIN
ncbi:3-oxoacyl-ACP synthase III family protein [Aquimarina hainanensis]|uniref:3-oxoacyl-ACP synthase III family protein n=1 Tax=Aquimarina hainanensis TaxID=1578017 RepID=A0ABW5N777_9FLAO|nr:ketoacyl-ACP synthase III [Aquimarina sp. TRL1]QKX05480.1 ketoacyl-ACP synthase III [Aquimarina sp. TRL1]